MEYRKSQNKHEESFTQEGLPAHAKTLPASFIALIATAVLAIGLASCGDPTPEPTAAPLSTIPTAGTVSQTPVSPTAAPTTSDMDALVSLYNATNGPSWKHDTKWLSGEPLGIWYGVTTDDNSRVTELVLNRNGLSGKIPPELGNLSKLEKLDLGSNELTGSFPPELIKLQSLTYLDVGGTSLIGCLPDSWERRFRLRDVDYDVFLEGSDLGGLPFCFDTSVPEVPEARDALIALYKAADGPNWKNNLNWLTAHPIGIWHGVTIGEGGRVIELRLPDNDLSGEIPLKLSNLTDLRVLDLRRNDLIGEIPPELGKLTNLLHLDLSVNRLSGKIPPELGLLIRLSELNLHVNDLSGSIPRRLGSIPRLYSLSLWNNRLSGKIPPELGNLAHLEALDLAGNRLSGEVPSELGGLARLERLGLGRNRLNGCVPSSLRAQLEMSESTLEGLPFCGAEPVPEGPAATGSDRDALVAFYQAAGGRNWINNVFWLSALPIREWYGVTTNDSGRVTRLEFIDNRLNGEIPPQLGNLSDLQELYISDSWVEDRLNGEIPPRIRQTCQPAGNGPKGSVLERGDSAGVGQPHQPSKAQPCGQSVEWGDPAGVGTSLQSASVISQRKPIEWSYSLGIWEPSQPAGAFPF